jgi:hypothetical protein
MTTTISATRAPPSPWSTALADSSSWSGVIERLHTNDIAVKALVNPLRGVASDSAYVASPLRQVPAP